MEVRIEKLDDLGQGIAHINNKVCFIPNALENELVDIEIIEEKKKYVKAKLVNIIEPSRERIKPMCPYYNNCGGCSLGHLNPDKVLVYKKDKVKNIIFKNTKIEIEPICIESDKIDYYRNKVTLKIENYEWGYYSIKTHDFVAINTCLLAKEAINKVIGNKDFLKLKNGEITLRCNDKDEILISVVTEEKYKIAKIKLKDLNIRGIVVNDKTIYGESFFYHTINNLTFKVSYNSFFQINDYICSKLFDILNSLNLEGNILDLYCGVGSLGLSLAQNANNIYGIEIIPNAINDAKFNAKLNNVKNTTYFVGNVKDQIKNIKEKIKTLLIDPPRKGLDSIAEIIDLKIPNIVYISCDPITLGRDLKDLSKFYELKKVYVLNMFPNTYHVESLCLLKLK